MHVYFISLKKMGTITAWLRCLSNKSMNNIFPFLLHILTAFVSLFGLNPKRAYVCSFNWFQAKSIFWTYARKCLQKMMSLVFIVFLLPCSFFIYFIGFGRMHDWSSLALERKMKWASKMRYEQGTSRIRIRVI